MPNVKSSPVNEICLLPVDAIGEPMNGQMGLGYVPGTGLVLRRFGHDEESVFSFSGYDESGSFQAVPADLVIGVDAGSDDAADPDFIAAVMGNLIREDVSNKDKNYLAGVIGALSALGAPGNTYPVGGVLGIIMDGVEEADGAVVGVIDGDSAVTHVNAIFAARSCNSNPGSGASYGLDLYGDGVDGFADLDLDVAEIRFSKDKSAGATIQFGTVDPSAAAGIAAARGSFYVKTDGDATHTLWVKTGAADTDWTNK